MRLKLAEALATEWVKKLHPFCERIQIAGSIRRQQENVKDIEILCIPKVQEVATLFGPGKMERHLGFSDAIYSAVRANEVSIMKGDVMAGKYVQIYLMEHYINIDLFTAVPENWGHILAIRTGPPDYSHRVLGHAWSSLGYHSEEGMLMSNDRKVPIPEEQDLFNLLKLPYTEPWNRKWPI